MSENEALEALIEGGFYAGTAQDGTEDLLLKAHGRLDLMQKFREFWGGAVGESRSSPEAIAEYGGGYNSSWIVFNEEALNVIRKLEHRKDFLLMRTRTGTAKAQYVLDEARRWSLRGR